MRSHGSRLVPEILANFSVPVSGALDTNGLITLAENVDS